MTARSLIGISTELAVGSWHSWSRPAAILSMTYVEAVERAGAVPMLLPPVAPGYAAAAMGSLDALVIAGGSDVDPARYSAARHPRTESPAIARDAWELALIEATLERRLPLVGICRGMQLLNVALGGTLVQHLPEVVGHEAHAPLAGVFGEHSVRLTPGSRLASIWGAEIVLPTYHHQAVGELGTGVSAVGWASDETVEAIEVEDYDCVVGVQGHPEEAGDEALFDHLVRRCSLLVAAA